MNAFILKYWPLVSTYLAIAALAVAIFNLGVRMFISQKTIQGWDKTHPRIANFFRFFRASGTDINKSLKAFYCILSGKPWPAILDELPTPSVPETPPN